MSTKLCAALLAFAVSALGAASADAAVAANLLAAVLGADCASPVCDPACAPGPCCQPTITYVHHGCKVCCGCQPPIETSLAVQIPCGCTCMTVNVPVCLPGCCTGTPQVNSHWGPLGRGVVRYDYCCGVSVKIIVRCTGDIVVHYIHA